MYIAFMYLFTTIHIQRSENTCIWIDIACSALIWLHVLTNVIRWSLKAETLQISPFNTTDNKQNANRTCLLIAQNFWNFDNVVGKMNYPWSWWLYMPLQRFNKCKLSKLFVEGAALLLFIFAKLEREQYEIEPNINWICFCLCSVCFNSQAWRTFILPIACRQLHCSCTWWCSLYLIFFFPMNSNMTYTLICRYICTDRWVNCE